MNFNITIIYLLMDKSSPVRCSGLECCDTYMGDWEVERNLTSWVFLSFSWNLCWNIDVSKDLALVAFTALCSHACCCKYMCTYLILVSTSVKQKKIFPIKQLSSAAPPLGFKAYNDLIWPPLQTKIVDTWGSWTTGWTTEENPESIFSLNSDVSLDYKKIEHW